MPGYNNVGYKLIQLFDFITAPVTVQHARDILEWTHSRTFLKMLHLATSSLMLKTSTFTVVYNVVFTLA